MGEEAPEMEKEGARPLARPGETLRIVSEIRQVGFHRVNTFARRYDRPGLIEHDRMPPKNALIGVAGPESWTDPDPGGVLR